MVGLSERFAFYWPFNCCFVCRLFENLEYNGANDTQLINTSEHSMIFPRLLKLTRKLAICQQASWLHTKTVLVSRFRSRTPFLSVISVKLIQLQLQINYNSDSLLTPSQPWVKSLFFLSPSGSFVSLLL